MEFWSCCPVDLSGRPPELSKQRPEAGGRKPARTSPESDFLIYYSFIRLFAEGKNSLTGTFRKALAIVAVF
jgi:hypothetical protein